MITVPTTGSAWRPSAHETPARDRALRERTGHTRAGKIDEVYVRCIRAAADRGLTTHELAAMFPKLRASAIRAIVRRTAWRHA